MDRAMGAVLPEMAHEPHGGRAVGAGRCRAGGAQEGGWRRHLWGPGEGGVGRAVREGLVRGGVDLCAAGGRA